MTTVRKDNVDPPKAILSADTKFNSATYQFTVHPDAAGCDQALDLESVATHETDHMWGIDDVSAPNHPNLTMRSGGLAAIRCNTGSTQPSVVAACGSG